MVADLSELPPDAFEGALRGYLHPLAQYRQMPIKFFVRSLNLQNQVSSVILE